MTALRQVGTCCYGEGRHEDWCPIPAVPAEITPTVAAAALLELARVFDDGRNPGRTWGYVLEYAVECGRRLRDARPGAPTPRAAEDELLNYAYHLDTCPAPELRCTCGFDELLARLARAVGKPVTVHEVGE